VTDPAGTSPALTATRRPTPARRCGRCLCRRRARRGCSPPGPREAPPLPARLLRPGRLAGRGAAGGGPASPSCRSACRRRAACRPARSPAPSPVAAQRCQTLAALTSPTLVTRPARPRAPRPAPGPVPGAGVPLAPRPLTPPQPAARLTAPRAARLWALALLECLGTGRQFRSGRLIGLVICGASRARRGLRHSDSASCVPGAECLASVSPSCAIASTT
jgi:hypothetical protein